MSLQEIVLPVLKINKGQRSDVNPVDISILTGSSRTITTSQLSIKLFQETNVSEKVHARTLQLGIYNQSGDLISDTHTLIFDNDSSNKEIEKHIFACFLENQQISLIMKMFFLNWKKG